VRFGGVQRVQLVGSEPAVRASVGERSDA
jgi:hypothetical protein